MIRALYRALTLAGSPLVHLALARRARRGKEDQARIPERFGRAGLSRPPGPLLWLHAASVGESLSALPLVERLLSMRPDIHVLVTTGTVTSASLMARRLPPRASHQYAPVDVITCVRRFLDHWRPDLALWMESEFWPNLVFETHARSIPLVLLNARVSDRAFARWRRAPFLIKPLLSAFAACLAQSEREAQRLRSLGAAHARTAGNLKCAAPPLPCDGEELGRLERHMGARPRWLAASTHDGEEEIAAGVHRELAQRFPGLLTVVVPRHPARGEPIAQRLAARGLAVALRSKAEVPFPGTDIFVADTMGELGLFYRLCHCVFVGGSLVPHGGHNVLEPAALGCAVVHGPHMANFLDIARDMREAGASEQVAGASELARALEGLLRDPALVKTRGERALAVAASERAVLDRVMAEVSVFLDAIPRSERI